MTVRGDGGYNAIRRPAPPARDGRGRTGVARPGIVASRPAAAGVADDAGWGLEESEVRTLRQFTHRGRPLGTDSFLSRMESLLGRRVRPLPVGRPKGKGKRK